MPHPDTAVARRQQRQPALQAHAHADGELVRRRHHHQLGAWPLRRALFNHQAFAVQRHRPHLGAMAQQRGADAGVAGVFHHHLVAGVHQQAGDEVQRLL